MTRLHYNALRAALGAALTSSATSITFTGPLTYNNGVAVPTITGSDYIPLTVLDASGYLSEVVWLTAYTAGATTGTITRAREGTTGVAHAFGDVLVQAVTADDLGSVVTKDLSDIGQVTIKVGTWSVSGGVLGHTVNTEDGVAYAQDTASLQGTAQVDFQYVSTDGNSNMLIGLSTFSDNTAASPSGKAVYGMRRTGTNQWRLRAFNYGISEPYAGADFTLSDSAWHTFKIQFGPLGALCSLDGALLASIVFAPYSPGSVAPMGVCLASLHSAANFRNFVYREPPT